MKIAEILSIISGTFILEDATTLSCGLLVSQGLLNYWVALVSLFIGIVLGDIGLYFFGSLSFFRQRAKRAVGEPRYDELKEKLHHRAILILITARFLPGMRLPTYVSAGLVQVPFPIFFSVVVIASILWTVFLLELTILFGATIIPLVEKARWILFVVLLILLLFFYLRRRIIKGDKNIE